MPCTKFILLLSLAFVGLVESAKHNKKVLAVSDCTFLDTVSKEDWQACGTFCTMFKVCDIWEFENGQCKTYRYKDSANQPCQLESTLDDVIGGLKGCTGEDKIPTDSDSDGGDSDVAPCSGC